MTLKLSNPLVAGENYVLKFEYIGFLKNNNFGFYISEYEMDGKTRYVASSQMQGPYARSVKKKMKKYRSEIFCVGVCFRVSMSQDLRRNSRVH